MQRPRFPRTPHAEDGAVLVIVVLSLLAMFGMMVLVVDVGSLLYARRELVNAADAAALAAAQSCGQKEGMGEAIVQARFYAVENQSEANLVSGYPIFFPSCDAPAGLVTVHVTTDRPLFFAPVLGADAEAAVTTAATASWGGAGVGEKVAPLMLSANRLSDCDIPPDTPTSNVGLECAFYWNNSSSGNTEPDLANAEWGTLDLLKWDITTGVNCDNSTPPQFEEWMLRGFNLPLPIDSSLYGGTAGDDHTYVCRGQGHFGEALDHDIEAAIALGDPIYFPVNRPTTQVDSNGDVCSPDLFATTNCAVDKYDIIGFARLFIREIWGGGSERDEVVEHCGHFAGIEEDPNARCMIAEWVGYTPEGLDSGGGENFGLVPVRLVD